MILKCEWLSLSFSKALSAPKCEIQVNISSYKYKLKLEVENRRSPAAEKNRYKSYTYRGLRKNFFEMAILGILEK